MKTALILACVIFLTFQSAHAHPQAEVLAKATKSWDGATLPNYPAKNPEITVLKITVPPKTKLGWHKHTVINAGYLIRGELSVFAEDGKSLQLKAGEALVELVGKWHYGRNDSDKPAEIVVFYAGQQGEPITIMKEAEHPDDAPAESNEE